MTSKLRQEEAELPQVMSLLRTTTYEQHVPGQQQFPVVAWKNTPSSRSATLRARLGHAAKARGSVGRLPPRSSPGPMEATA